MDMEKDYYQMEPLMKVLLLMVELVTKIINYRKVLHVLYIL